jgi:hypothetical protein
VSLVCILRREGIRFASKAANTGVQNERTVRAARNRTAPAFAVNVTVSTAIAVIRN